MQRDPPSDVISFAQSGSVIDNRGQKIALVRPEDVKIIVNEDDDAILLIPKIIERRGADFERRQFLKCGLK